MSNADVKQYGLIGYPLGHSFSPKYFENKFKKAGLKDHRYDLYPITVCFNFRLLLFFHKNIKGLNVTIPYKEEIMAYLDEIDDLAKEVGAVNTIVFKDGKTIGHNTDVPGFMESTTRFFEAAEKKPSAALILGTGGAAKAACFALDKMSVATTLVSRTPDAGQLAYDEINEAVLAKHQLIVNTTPLGTFPKVDNCPDIRYDKLSSNHLLLDLIYNPEKTLFLTKGEAQGCAIKNGLDMLKVQAEKSWDLWTK